MTVNEDRKVVFEGPGPDVQYREFLASGEFKLQCCDDCRRFIYYPRVLCPHCGSNQLQWRDVSGRGTVYSTSVPRKGPGQDADLNISLIDLDEGVRFLSQVVGMAPGEVTIGMRVQGFISELNGVPAVLFQADREVQS